MTYFNIKTSEGIETVDELSPEDFKTIKEYRQEAKRLLKEYSMCMPGVYRSQRCANNWK